MKPRSLTLTAGALQPELVGERATADADDDDVDLDVLDFAAVADDAVHRGAARVCRRVADHLHRRANVDVLLLEAAHDDVGDIAVEPGKDLRQPFEDGHLRAEVGERAGELATDRAATDHDDAARHVVEHQHLVAGHDRTRRLEAGDGARHRPAGEHHVGATNRRRALGPRDRHGVIRSRVCRRLRRS